MTDREMLEFAAKAAGMTIDTHYVDGGASAWAGERHNSDWIPNWNPLTDDGDNARLEAMLGLNVIWGSRSVRVGRKLINDGPMVERYHDHGGDRQKARRRASVRAAAEIGRTMK